MGDSKYGDGSISEAAGNGDSNMASIGLAVKGDSARSVGVAIAVGLAYGREGVAGASAVLGSIVGVAAG